VEDRKFHISYLSPGYWLIWLGFGVLWLIMIMPQAVRNALGRGLGWLVWRFSAARRQTAARNIAACFPALSAAARDDLVRRHFLASGAALMGASLVWWGSARRLRRLVRFAGREHYDQALAAGRRIILLAPHFLGLEIGGIFLAHERPVVSMYKRSKNPLVEWMMRRSRERFGAEMFERDGSLMRLIRLVRSGRPFYYLPDQNPVNETYVFAPFFGVPAATLTALARISELTDAVVIPCVTCLLPGGQGYEIRFGKPFAGYPSGDAVQDATQMNAVIEAAAREMPEQYMWTYKRFKHQPPGAPPFYG
jgi:lipid A biosynthesis lauroyl/palmitoleoyl acyltransferase